MCPSLMPSPWCSWEGEGKCQLFLKGSQELNTIKLTQKCPIVALPPAQGQTSLGKMCWPQISSGASFWSETQVKAWPGEEKSRGITTGHREGLQHRLCSRATPTLPPH